MVLPRSELYALASSLVGSTTVQRGIVALFSIFIFHLPRLDIVSVVYNFTLSAIFVCVCARACINCVLPPSGEEYTSSFKICLQKYVLLFPIHFNVGKNIFL